MRWLLLVALTATAVQAQDPRFKRFTTRTPQGRNTRGLLSDSLPFFEAFPASGAGTTTACSTTPPTGAKGEALTFTRSSVAECYSNDGQTLTQLAANQPRVSSGHVGDSQLGLWDENASQNDILHARDPSQAAWVKTNMTCVHTATGMRGDANGATTCTATAANATVCQTIVTAAATRTSSWHLKRRTATGAATLARDGATYSSDIASQLSTTLWKRAVPYETPGCAGGHCILVPSLSGSVLNPQICLKLATSGDAVDIDFVQDEAGDGATTPIATAGVAIPRAGEVSYFDVASFIPLSLGVRIVNRRPNRVAFVSYIWAGDASTNATALYDPIGATSLDMTAQALNLTGGVGAASGATVPFLPPGPGLTDYSLESVPGVSWTIYTKGKASTFATAVSPPAVTRIYVGTYPGFGGLGSGTVHKNVCASFVAGACTRTATTTLSSPIAMLGDSITLGQGGVTTRIPPYVSALMQRPVYNHGVGSDTAAQCATRWASNISGKGYSSLVVECGVNSLGAGLSAAAIYATLSGIWDAARAQGMTVRPMTICPWKNAAGWTAGRQTETEALNTMIRDYGTTNSLAVIDCYAGLGGEGGDPAVLLAIYNSGDNIHPNAAGAAALAGLVAASSP